MNDPIRRAMDEALVSPENPDNPFLKALGDYVYEEWKEILHALPKDQRQEFLTKLCKIGAYGYDRGPKFALEIFNRD